MIILFNKMMWKILVWPLSQIYAMIMQIRNFCYEKQWLSSKRLPAKMISVGNITVGGTGKTPLVESLASFLHEKGFNEVVFNTICNASKALVDLLLRCQKDKGDL